MTERPPVDQHCARPADPLLAADVRPVEPQPFTQKSANVQRTVTPPVHCRRSPSSPPRTLTHRGSSRLDDRTANLPAARWRRSPTASISARRCPQQPVRGPSPARADSTTTKRWGRPPAPKTTTAWSVATPRREGEIARATPGGLGEAEPATRRQGPRSRSRARPRRATSCSAGKKSSHRIRRCRAETPPSARPSQRRLPATRLRGQRTRSNHPTCLGCGSRIADVPSRERINAAPSGRAPLSVTDIAPIRTTRRPGRSRPARAAAARPPDALAGPDATPATARGSARRPTPRLRPYSAEHLDRLVQRVRPVVMGSRRFHGPPRGRTTQRQLFARADALGYARTSNRAEHANGRCERSGSERGRLTPGAAADWESVPTPAQTPRPDRRIFTRRVNAFHPGPAG